MCSRTTAQWVVAHPSYPGWAASISHEVELELVDDPLDQLELVSEVFQVAARKTIAEAVALSEEGRPAWVAHWLSAARAAASRRDGLGLRRALLRGPEHAGLFDIDVVRLRSEVAFVEALRVVVVHASLVLARRHDVDHIGTGQSRSAVRAKYASLFSMRAVAKRTFCRVSVSRLDGTAARTDAEGLKFLRGRIGAMCSFRVEALPRASLCVWRSALRDMLAWSRPCLLTTLSGYCAHVRLVLQGRMVFGTAIGPRQAGLLCRFSTGPTSRSWRGMLLRLT